ncbi:MAG: alpha/beta fold hydrolase [Fibrobacterota bacterium]
MNTETLVLGGWACPPSILKPLFGDCRYIDINYYATRLIESGSLMYNWPEKLIDAMDPPCGAITTLVGWSTGAIMALGLAPILHPSRTILLSATRSFCRRDDFRFGMPEKMVRGMIQGLKSDREKTLGQFFRNCGFKPPYPDTTAYTTQQLSDGLVLLTQISLPLSDLCHYDEPPLLLHGKDDRIIPCKAGEKLGEQLKAPFKCFQGGHAFFLEENAIEEISNLNT